MSVKEKYLVEDIKEKIRILVISTTNFTNRPTEKFIAISVGVGLFAGLLIGLVVQIQVAILSSIIAMFVPFVYLKSRQQIKRAGHSKEGEILVSELIANYKISYCNITEAIESTAKLIEGAPYSKALLFDLALGLNTAVSKEDVNKLLDSFKHSIGTVWADVLATNIYFAITQGININRSLQDLFEGLLRSRRIVEYNKREINESTMMLKFLAPSCVILTVFCATCVFDMPLNKYLYYQFGTTTGLTWFLIVIFTYIFGTAVNIFFTSKRLDL